MKKRHIYLVLIIAVAALSLFLGLDSTLFYSKGEPREALVAVEILNTGNWILPALDGIDLPYKPPMLAWLTALCSMYAGRVTELTARIPSVIAMIALMLMCFRFFSRRSVRHADDAPKAFVTAMILLAAVETHRAAIVSRVDMLLTAFIVGAMFSLYNWRARDWKGVPVAGILAMSAATLTKGPIGIVLPCLVVWVFAIAKADKFWNVTWRLAVAALAAVALPAVYYILAYNQGGSEFLSLAMEENFGRFTGTMSYSSHLHPFYYNFLTLLAGLLPFTLFLAFSLFAIKWHKTSPTWKGSVGRFRGASSKLAFSAAAAAVVVAVYCIPASKRSVYLLPAYPFLAFLIAEWMFRLRRRHSHVIKAYNYFLVALALIYTLLFAELYLDIFGLKSLLPKSMAPSLWAVVSARHSLFNAIIIGLPIVAVIAALVIRRRPTLEKHIYAMLALSLTVYMAASVAVINPLLNQKSDFLKAKEVATLIPKGKFLSAIKNDPRLRFYTIDFYTDNRVVAMPFDSKEPLPASANILLNADEDEEFIAAHPERNFRLIWDSAEANSQTPKSCDSRRPIRLYAFD